MRLNIYSQGKSLSEVCPIHLKEQWGVITERISAHHRSYVEAKIALNGYSLKELIPDKIYLNYQDLREKIEAHVFENHEQPENYDFLCELEDLVEGIKKQKLEIDASAMESTPQNRDFLKKINKIRPYISYNMFGTKTGRLTTNPGSFPILTLKKENRSIIKPQKDCFLEMDFNAFELRVVLALMGKEQPREDLHDWNIKNVYRGLGTREQAKKRMFAWLYNPNSDDQLTNRYYDRGKIKERFFSSGVINTIFTRRIEADNYHAFNYIIQSTASDLFLQQAIKVDRFIEKSNIAFMIHDSLVLDFDKTELDRIKQIRQNFSQTIFGDFPISMKIGKNYGEMKEWKL